jgi:hypothetical protein
VLSGSFAGVSSAVDWNSLPYTPHSTYQAIQANGSSAYTGGFPIKIRGVVLNNTEDWLDPTPNYTSTYQPFNMGGQAEIVVQTIDPGDFGGTFCWMGQNYGNLPFKADPVWNYTNPQWTAELGRLNYFGGDNVTSPIRAGDLVEVRGRIGLFFGGKMNINEAHDNRPQNDFEVVLLQANYGLPTPTMLSLADLKDTSNNFLFDPTRATGPERHQATRVRLGNVKFTAATLANWGRNRDVTVEDALGRTLAVRLANHPDFATTLPPTDWLDIVGIFDQADPTVPHDSGYRLLVMNPSDVIIPEPASLGLLLSVGVLVARRRRD